MIKELKDLGAVVLKEPHKDGMFYSVVFLKDGSLYETSFIVAKGTTKKEMARYFRSAAVTIKRKRDEETKS